MRKAAQNDYRFASIIMGIVESAPFQMRTKLEPAETVNSVAVRSPRQLMSKSGLRRALGAEPWLHVRI